MKICKKKKKQLKYQSDFFISKLLYNGKEYYSIDGIGFAHNRYERLNLSDLYFSSKIEFASIFIVEITNKTNTLDIFNSIYYNISCEVNHLNQILILADKI